MRAHAEQCAACREQLYLWAEISRQAPALHEEWESPFLWQRIQANLAAEPARQKIPWTRWALACAGNHRAGGSRTATDETRETGRSGPSYGKARCKTCSRRNGRTPSIEKLSAVAAQDLDRSSSPLAAAYREKLALLDSGIAELKATVASNRYNTYLQTELAALYRQKQLTLQEWLQNANHN